MTTVENYWAKNFDEKSKNQVQEELLVFGYSCKLFRDDEKALYIDQGRHLIPWMNDDSLMIDRYDVRGYLHDLSLYEPKPPEPVSLTPEETRIEQTCEEERYLALHKDLTEEEMYHEEELKRLKAALASEGAYHEIAFTYENENSQSSTSSEDTKADETDEQYIVPSGLALPAGIQLPPTMKLHRIIEKTATFVAQHGGQMEIIIKMKQSTNPQFEFLSFDHVLNPYYKFLVSSIKSGKYVPLKTVVKNEDDDDDDADGHYLHPSLFAAKADNTPMSLPNIQFRCDENDTYSLLVKNLNKLSAARKAVSHHRISHIAKSKTNTSQTSLEKKYPSLGIACDQPPPPGEGPALLLPSTLDSLTGSPGSSEKLTDILSQIIPPPPDIQPVIDKMATYVAKNGEDFETIVKSKGDKRFDFLLSWHEYYPYYLFKKKLYTEEKRQQLEKEQQQQQQQQQQQKQEEEQKEQATENTISEDQENSKDSQESETNKSSKNNKAPVSFSIKTKDTDTLQLEKKKTALLLDDDSGEEDAENHNSDIDAKAKLEHKDDPPHVDSPSRTSDLNSAESEDKPRKLTQEELEAKFAEERIKDKLAAAARERLVQQSRDRQLQQERKRKATLFLNKLKNPDSSEECAQVNSDSVTAENCDKQVKKSHASALSSAKTSPLNSPEFQTSPFLSLPSSPIPLTKEDINDKGKGFSMASYEDSVRLSRLLAESGSLSIQRLKSKSRKRTPSPAGRPHHKHRHHSPSHPTSKPKKRSRSKNRTEHKKRSRSRSKSKSHKKHVKSPSEPLKLKDDRSKTPPAAYSLVRRSKTRSPSPSRRHRYGLPLKHKAPRK